MLVIEPVNINEVVAKTWHDAQQDTQALQVSFETSLAQGLPEVMGNIEGLERVFFNLFLNAIQAVSRKGKVVVETHLLPSENMVEVDVVDDGPGIPAMHRPRIFEHFFTTKEEGTGLGLSLCRAIVKQHKGEIHVDCPPGGGTRVTVKLPVGQSSLKHNQQPEAEIQPSNFPSREISLVDELGEFKGWKNTTLRS